MYRTASILFLRTRCLYTYCSALPNINGARGSSRVCRSTFPSVVIIEARYEEFHGRRIYRDPSDSTIESDQYLDQ